MRRQTIAKVVGALFITATAAGVLSAVALGAQDAPALLATASARADQLRLGALAVLVMAVAIAMIPAMIFPVLKERSEALALGYVVARTIEVVVLLPVAVGPLLLTLSARDLPAGGPGETAPTALATLILAYDDWGHPVSAVFFCAGAGILNYLLYRSRLVPRLISGWGFLAVAPYLVDALLVMFGRLSSSSGLHAVLIVPLALNEMVLAIWLLAKGFAATADMSTVDRDGTAAVPA